MWIAALLFIIILGLFLYLDTKKPHNFPPGPKWLPIIGSAWIVHKLRKKTGSLSKATADLAKEYGTVFSLKVGKDRTVVVYGLEAIRQFLGDDNLNGRPLGLFYEIRTWGKRRGILLTDEDLWQEQRRFVVRHLREFGFGRRNMSLLIEDECAIMVQTLKKRIENSRQDFTLPMHELFGIHILNTLWTMLAGLRYSPDDKELRNLQTILADLFANIDMVGTLFSHFPFLRFIAPEFSGYNKYIATHVALWKFLDQELKKHKETFKEDEPRDFMDVYLQMLNTSDKNESFTEIQLLAICLDLFIAGSETTNKTLGFAFLYILLNPEVQKKAQQEIDNVIGRQRLPTLADRARMPYVECVVLETLRHFTGRAFTIPHRALKDTTLHGYFIPKDTMIVANFRGVLLGDESGYSDPETFRPERFMKDGHVTVPDSHLPFGFGKHRCMGETLAKANVFLFIASLLQNFNFEIPSNYKNFSAKFLDGATPATVPFNAKISLRE